MLRIQTAAFNGYLSVLEEMATGNPVRAAEINLQAIQGRLEKAEAEAVRGDIPGVEKALQEYEKLRRLNARISSSAQAQGYDTTAIDEMNARATGAHLEMLGHLYGGVPEETQAFVEEALIVAIQEHGHAIQGLQQQGAQGDIPTEPSIPAEVPEEIQQRIQGSASTEPNGSGEHETPGPGEEQGQGNSSPPQQDQQEGNPPEPVQPPQTPSESPKTTEPPGPAGPGNGHS